MCELHLGAAQHRSRQRWSPVNPAVAEGAALDPLALEPADEASADSAAVGSSPPLDNGGWIAETAMLTLRATFDTRAAACDAHPRWIAALDAMRDRLRDEFAVTELFVSKHRTAAPAPTLVGMD